MVGNTTGNNVCRRCKKKRPEDEPMETARYRTCKPCREIERKLKRIKKAQMTGQSIDDINSDLQQKKAQEIEQNIINMARQVQSTLPQSDIQGLSDAVHGVDPSIHQHNNISAAVNAAVSAAAAAVNAVNQGPPQIHQYDQSRDSIGDSHHQPMMPVQSAIDAQKEIPIDESLLKQGADEEDVNSHQTEGVPGDTASLTKSPILKSEASPSTAVTSTGEQTDSKPTPQQINNNNENIESNNNNNNNEEEDENKQTEDVNRERSTSVSASPMKTPGGSKGVHTAEGVHHCLYCGVVRTIEDNGRYNLCGNCVANPLQKANVFDDFDAYLEKIEKGKDSDLRNVIFIKKITDLIPDFQINNDQQTDNNLAEVVTALNEGIIFPIMERSGFRFSKSSSNFSTKPYPKSIKLLYKCKQDLKTIQKQGSTNVGPTIPGANNSNLNNRRLKTEDCQSNLYINYDVIGKNLTVKFNHNTHTPYLQKLYTSGVLERVSSIANKNTEPKDGFALWRELCEMEQNEQLKNEMSTVKEMVFCKDFGPLFKNFAY